MDPLSVMLVATLLVTPASGGNLLVKDVSTSWVNMDWTEVVSGLEIMMKGVYHNVTLLFSTQDPWTFRLVEQSSFSGTIGVRGSVPLLGTVSAVEEYNLFHTRFVGVVTMDPTGLVVPVDGVLSERIMGTLTLVLGGETTTASVNGLLMMKIQNGVIEWARLGPPMGWPFQLLVA